MPAKDILLIDADLTLAFSLEAAGFQVRSATSRMQGLTMARELFPDLVLLGLELPDGSGWEVISRLRVSSAVPIIVLSSQDAVQEKVALLRRGADDYLVKPVAVREVLARIEVQLRRRQVPEERLSCRGLTVRPQQALVTFQGEVVKLTETERRILVVLMRQPGRVCSRAEFVRDVWASRPYAKHSNVVDVHLNRLRAKLSALPWPGLIQTVRQSGYVLRGEAPHALDASSVPQTV